MTRQNIKIQLTEYTIEIPEKLSYFESMEIQSKMTNQVNMQTQGLKEDANVFGFMIEAMQIVIKGIYKNEQKLDITIKELLNDISVEEGNRIWDEINKLINPGKK